MGFVSFNFLGYAFYPAKEIRCNLFKTNNTEPPVFCTNITSARWFVWILGGLFFEQLARYLPLVYTINELDTLLYHTIAAGILLYIQLGYCILFYLTEKNLVKDCDKG